MFVKPKRHITLKLYFRYINLNYYEHKDQLYYSSLSHCLSQNSIDVIPKHLFYKWWLYWRLIFFANDWKELDLLDFRLSVRVSIWIISSFLENVKHTRGLFSLCQSSHVSLVSLPHYERWLIFTHYKTLRLTPNDCENPIKETKIKWKIFQRTWTETVKFTYIL